LVEAICKELLEVHLGVDWQKYRSIPIRNDCDKVISWNDLFVQTEWDRGTFRLWTKGSAFRVNFTILCTGVKGDARDVSTD